MSDWRDTYEYLTLLIFLVIVCITESSPLQLSTPGAYARMLLDPGVFSFKEAAMPKVKVSPGDRYGRLTVVKELEPKTYPSGKKGRIVECSCTCGVVCTYTLSNLRKGNSTSCGCKRVESCSTHGLHAHPLYYVWTSMNRRCTDPTDINYERYGGIGITVCPEWSEDVGAFIHWMEANGWNKGLQVDRVDNEKGYHPDNCRLVTAKENARNRKDNVLLTVGNTTRCLAEWVEVTGLNRTTIRARLNRGWSVEDALTKEVQHV